MPELQAFIARWRAPRPLLLAADGLWDLTNQANQADLKQGTQNADIADFADFAAWCSAHPRQRCTLWLGSSLLTDLVCEAGAPLQSPTLRTAWARRVLAHYHGDVAAAWALLPWRRHAALGASVLHGVPLQVLRDTAAAHAVVLTAVRPLWPLLLDRLLARRPALRRATAAHALLVEAAVGGAADGPAGGPAGGSARGSAANALLTVVSLSAGRVVAVSRRRLQPATAERLQELLHELLPELSPADTSARGSPVAALLMGAPPMPGLALDVVETLHAPYPHALPRAAAADADFLHPSPRVGPLAWAWLGTALLVLGVAALDAFGAWQARTQAFAVALPAAPRLGAAQRVAAVQYSPAEAALRTRLAHPWRDVFLATEAPAAAGLVWLSMDHAPGGDLRLQGLAADADTVHRVAATLRSRPAWRQVLVSRLETRDQGQGQAFEIAARLAGAAP